jgi:ABC-type multidrug transport system fused ATPase/permease subunit
MIESVGIAAIGIYVWVLAGRPGGIAAAIPTLGALALGAQRLLPQLQQAYVGWSAAIGNSALVDDVARLLTLEDRVAPLPKGTPPSFHDSIRFHGVDFAYPGGATVLSGVDLTIFKGERIGISGPTGSGKSTLMDLLLGLLEPSAGKITVDGQPLVDERRALWQSAISHIPQAIYLSDTSLAANIAFGIPESERDLDRVHAAAAEAGIADFIDQLPEGYDTFAGERGVRLSGGQRQRIGIARALYRRPKVLILDEATSALDTATESAVMASINALDDDMTIIMIAHRLSTLENCDRVLRVEKGQVSETRDGRKSSTKGP